MKYSVEWLNELAGTALSVEEMAGLFTRHSFEVDGMEISGGVPEGVVAGKILEVSPHPNADRLKMTKVDVGSEYGGILSIVCGSPNVAAGQTVAVALVGATLPNDIKIKKSKIRGEESCGMICGIDELGMGEETHDVWISDQDIPVGTPAKDVFSNSDESTIDLDILASRGRDALSHRGIAREISAVNRLQVTVNSKHLKEGMLSKGSGEQIDVSVEDEKKCKRYIGVLLTNVNNRAETPEWMKRRLRACGIKSINIATDITNYVMLEMGQPLHAFDFGKIKSEFPISNTQFPTVSLSVRNAKNGEKLVLLDGSEVALHAEDLVIADGEKPMALAGVMGGKDSGTDEDTTSVFLEAAWFDPVSVRKTRIRHKLTTESAYRFERDVDPNGTEDAAARAVDLFREFAGADVAEAIDHYPEPEESRKISVRPENICRLLGADIAPQEIKELLEALDLDVDMEGKTLTVTVPTFRKDLLDEADIAEEIGRLRGYDRIEPAPLLAPVRSSVPDAARRLDRLFRDVLLGAGYDEMLTYSFYSEKAAETFGLERGAHFEIQNPMNPDQQRFRISILPNLLASMRGNIRRFETVRVFEVGNVYTRGEDGNVLENRRAGLALASREKAASGERVFAVKGVLAMATNRLLGADIAAEAFEEGEAPSWLHPTQSMRILVDGEEAGVLGTIHPRIAKAYKLPEQTVVADIDRDVLAERFASVQTVYRPIGKFPEVSRDISLVVPDGVRASDMEAVFRECEAQNVRSFELFDRYEKDGERSVAYRLFFGADDRTLSGEEADAALAAVLEKLRKDLQVAPKG